MAFLDNFFFDITLYILQNFSFYVPWKKKFGMFGMTQGWENDNFQFDICIYISDTFGIMFVI